MNRIPALAPSSMCGAGLRKRQAFSEFIHRDQPRPLRSLNRFTTDYRGAVAREPGAGVRSDVGPSVREANGREVVTHVSE
jgi:hypothetical protein